MKRWYRIIPIVLVLVAGAFLGLAWGNNASQPAAVASTSPEPVAVSSVPSAPTAASLPANAAVLTSAAPPPDSAVINPASTVVAASPGGGTTIIKTGAYAKIVLGLANLMNNVWGAPSAEIYNSGIFQSADGSFGWYWSRQAPVIKPGRTAVTPIYPSIRLGGTSPDRSTSAYFPVKLADVSTLVFNVAYAYPQIPIGSYDLAYDLFLSDPAQPASHPRIAAEVMIWIDHTSKQPLHCYRGVFTDGTNTFALYSWTMADGRAYYSFVLKSPHASPVQYQIDAAKLLSQIKLNSNWLLHGVEFGTEVYNGSGQIHISRFGINLNGTQILK